MPDHDDIHDGLRHRNLQRIANVLQLPPEADAARQARWQQTASPGAPADIENRLSQFRVYRRFVLATSGLAAAIAVLLWLALGEARPVSAATVFHHFKKAVAQSLSIRLEDLDLGTVRIQGTIAVERGAPGAADDRRYAEVHVLLKADNPAWNDLDAVLVACQTPNEAWQYCRGTGGGFDQEIGRVVPTEELRLGRGWDDFARHPLDDFGAMPVQLRFRDEDNQVTYRFFTEQRALVEQLLRFLLDLSDVETADALIEDLRRSPGEVRVERMDGTLQVLRATRFSRIGPLKLEEPKLPDVNELLTQVVWTIRYDPASKCVLGWGASYPPELREPGLSLQFDNAARELPVDSPENLLAHLRESAAGVEVDKSDGAQWDIRVTGYPVQVDMSGINWQRDFVRTLSDSLVLSIYYDTSDEEVRRAEFRGFGSPDGRITLEIGRAELDPQRLQSNYWVTEHTAIYGP
jgi:hypothetical protein